MAALGSEGLATEGATRPGPGLSMNLMGVSTENQIRPPAMCGIVTVVVEPGAPSGIAQFSARGAQVEGGEVG